MKKMFFGKEGSSIEIVDNGYDGKALLISGDILNDTRVYRGIEVEPNSYYKLTVMLRAMASLEGKGANISALYCNETYNVMGTYDNWLEYTVYVVTEDNQDVINFSLGLGGHEGLSSGYAYYDNFSLEKVSEVPEWARTITFKPFKSEEEVKVIKQNPEVIRNTLKIIFAIIIIALLMYAISIMTKRSKILIKKYKLDKKDYIIMGVLTLICAVYSFYDVGDFKGVSSFWKSGTVGEYIIIELDDYTTIEKIAHNGNIEEGGYYKISYSIGGDNFLEVATLGENIEIENNKKIQKSAFFAWEVDEINSFYCKYIKVESVEPGWGINELAFLKLNEQNELENVNFTIKETHTIADSIGTPEMLFDEQELVPMYYTHANSTYFDETYYARTAYDQLNGLTLFETTHPPLGKIIVSIGVSIFGMTPFGWRVMGTLFGVLLVPLMYLFAIKIFKSRKYAIIATLLIMFDFMRFAQTRMATIDSYSTVFVFLMYFFMYEYFINKTEVADVEDSKKKFLSTLKPLFLSGLMFGIGAATKWSCVYAAAGLALVFFLTKFYEFWQIRKNKDELKLWMKKDFVPTCLWCVVFFIIIPLIIYCLSYIVCIPSHPGQSLFEIIINNNKFMFEFHSQLVDSHPYESDWWSWPIDMRPILLFLNTNIPDEKYSAVATFGNPAVWIPAALAVLISIYFTYRDKDRRGLILLIAYVFQYIPWIIITRSQYIYAYFIPLPFSILLLVYCMEKINKGKIITKILLILYLLIVLALFIMFYPVISGMPVSEEYIRFLQWYPTWTF